MSNNNAGAQPHVIVCNAFSFNMIQGGLSASLTMEPVMPEMVEAMLGENWSSAIGHVDLAAVASATAGIAIPTNRTTVSMGAGIHRLLICQYQGPRLPEGAKELPEGASVSWLAVKVMVA